jgi:hypothetical protein
LVAHCSLLQAVQAALLVAWVEQALVDQVAQEVKPGPQVPRATMESMWPVAPATTELQAQLAGLGAMLEEVEAEVGCRWCLDLLVRRVALLVLVPQRVLVDHHLEVLEVLADLAPAVLQVLVVVVEELVAQVVLAQQVLLAQLVVIPQALMGQLAQEPLVVHQAIQVQ